MIKCKECGFEAERLQWTHFKYKCTGRFSNGKEYMAAYPGASVVSPELAKRTSVTEAGMIKKYGNSEGRIRWNSYREKQSISNSFEYKKEKHNWSEDQYKQYNLSRSSSLYTFITRHGETQGVIKWQEYCDRQAYTNSLNYFVEKYGCVAGNEKYNEICSLKAHTADNVMQRHGVSESQAHDILASRQSKLQYTSRLEINIINLIEEQLGEPLDHSIKSKQYCVYGNNKANFYDIVHMKRAIEVNGNYWHCNPATYKHNYLHPHAQILAEDIWLNDKAKVKLLMTERNIDTLVVWEDEYQRTPEQTIERCLKWIQTGQK